MTVDVPIPQAFAAYIVDGRLTEEGHLLLLAMQEAIAELQAQSADYEARITALEP